MELYCPECGYEDYTEARYCAMCGGLRSPDVPEPPELDPNGTGKLPHSFLLMNRYEIQHQIGRGGMAAVYEAIDTRTNRRMVIKELSAMEVSEPSDREHAVNRFYQEAQLLANLSHPNLPRVTDFFNAINKYYLVMDFVEGDSLQRILQRSQGPLQEAQVIPWGIQLCDALIYLHAHTPPIIFRDLKPSNIMVEPTSQVKLIDFGIARLFKPGQAQDTTALGTVGYAPPEQYGGLQSDPRTDIYALGVTLYELLTAYDPANRPFSLPPLREINPKVSVAMANIVMHAIELDPAKRWQSAQKIKDAIITYQRTGTERRSGTVKLEPPVRLTPRRIPLSCSLCEAVDKVFWTKRQSVVNKLVNVILERNPIEGKFIALIGYPGVGTSEICKRVKETVIERQRSMGQLSVALMVNLATAIQTDAAAQVWEEILVAMKAAEKGLDWRKRNVIDATYRRCMSGKTGSGSIRIKVASPVTLSFDFGAIKGSIGQSPFEYESTAEQQFVSGEQTMQQRRERLFNAIRELVIYLIQHNVRVTLIFDQVADAGLLNLLKPFATIGGISTVFVTAPDSYEVWAQEHQALIKRTIYVECLWTIGRELCRHLVKKGEEARTAEYDLFLKSLEFRGRGLPRYIIEELEKFYDDSTYQAGVKSLLGLTKDSALVLSEDRLIGIRVWGDLQQVLENSWETLFVDERGVSLLDMQKDWSRDQARLGVYKAMGWIMDQANNRQFFGRDRLYTTIASNTRFSKRKSKQIGDNLIAVLRHAGKLRVTKQGLDATGLLPPAHLV